MTKIKDGLNKFFEDVFIEILAHPIITSAILASLISALYYFGFIVQIKEVMPHIIAFSTITLAIIGVVLTLIVSIRDGKVYTRVKAEMDDARKDLFKHIRYSVATSIIVVICSITILIFDFSNINILIKLIVTFISSYVFVFMMCSSISSFKISIQMLIFDDEQ